MPVIKSAKKKLRQDIKAEKRNDRIRDILKNVIKKARKNPSEKLLQEAAKIVDKAAKRGIIHKNKAARIKSGVAKLLNNKGGAKKTQASQKTEKPKKKASVKRPRKTTTASA